MIDFLFGLITAGYLVIGLFFAKFWRRTRDPLFLGFCAAFWLLALNQLLALFDLSREERGWSFLLRLLAFSLLAVAIVYKNTAARHDAGSFNRPD
ncbi:MAG TPA: DUF5985 family protein [Stellaceae bacterium]|jgi:hypothetical protein|nr:DUF5985 family protein [Stellaceae bacterium]